MRCGVVLVGSRDVDGGYLDGGGATQQVDGVLPTAVVCCWLLLSNPEQVETRLRRRSFDLFPQSPSLKSTSKHARGQTKASVLCRSFLASFSRFVGLAFLLFVRAPFSFAFALLPSSAAARLFASLRRTLSFIPLLGTHTQNPTTHRTHNTVRAPPDVTRGSERQNDTRIYVCMVIN